MPTSEQLEAAGIKLLPCRYCHGESTKLFQLNQFVKAQGKRMDVATVQCDDCGASAPLNVWNSAAPPLIIRGKDYANYKPEHFPVTAANRDHALTSMVTELSDMLAVFPHNQIDPRAWTTLMIYAPKDCRADPLLIAELHRTGRHPFYEYTSTDTGRKAGYGVKPEGHGWILNTYQGRDGWDRDSHTETEYWMRTKEDAAQDEVNIYEFPPVQLGRVTADEIRDILRRNLSPVVMVSATNNQSFDRAAILTVTAEELYTAEHGTGVYNLTQDGPANSIYAVDHQEYMEIPAGTMCYVLHLESPAIQLLAVVDRQECPLWIRARKADGQYGKWAPFTNGVGIHLNKYDLEAVVQRHR